MIFKGLINEEGDEPLLQGSNTETTNHQRREKSPRKTAACNQAVGLARGAGAYHLASATVTAALPAAWPHNFNWPPQATTTSASPTPPARPLYFHGPPQEAASAALSAHPKIAVTESIRRVIIHPIRKPVTDTEVKNLVKECTATIDRRGKIAGDTVHLSLSYFLSPNRTEWTWLQKLHVVGLKDSLNKPPCPGGCMVFSYEERSLQRCVPCSIVFFQ